MNVVCANCQKETKCTFEAELYHCSECEEDFASYTKPTETRLRELMKIQAERMETKDAAIKGMRQELKQLRYKTSEQERFIFWIWNVYARHVIDLIYEIMDATTYNAEEEAKDGKWALPKKCFDLMKLVDKETEKIYDGTYLELKNSTIVTKQETFNLAIKQELTTIKQEDCFIVCQKCRGIIPPQIKKFVFKYCPSCGRIIVRKEKGDL